MFCSVCGKKIDSLDAKYCIFCGNPIETEQNKEAQTACPWEDMENIGFAKAFIDTIGLVLLKPTVFFRSLLPKGFLKSALLFGIFVGSLGYVFNAVWQLILSKGVSLPQFISEYASAGRNILGASIFFAPLIITIMIVFEGISTHVSLIIVGGNKKGFAATMRVLSYAMSAKILNVIPFVGGLISGVWMATVTVIGLREVHGISTARAVTALIMPFLLLVFLVIIALVVIVFMLPDIFHEIGREILPISI